MRVFYLSGFVVRARTRKAARKVFEQRAFSSYHARESVRAVKMVRPGDFREWMLMEAIFGSAWLIPEDLSPVNFLN